jgi:hypothetical protein
MCKELATFARTRLGVRPLHLGKVPFFFRVTAPLIGGWLGGRDSNGVQTQLDSTAASPKVASQLQSLRAALQMRNSTKNAVAVHTQPQPRVSPGEGVGNSPALQPLRHPALSPALRDATAPDAARLARDAERKADQRSSPGLLTSALWMKDEDVQRCCECNSEFTLFNRRHHCRVCGRIVDKRCCSQFHIQSQRHVDGAPKFHRNLELLCFPCQWDIQKGLTLDQTARNRLEARSRSVSAFDYGPRYSQPEPNQDMMRVSGHESGEPAHGCFRTSGAADADGANKDRFGGAPSPSAGESRLLTETSTEIDREADRNTLRGQLGDRTHRRRAMAAAPPFDVSQSMQLSDLYQDATSSSSAVPQNLEHAAQMDGLGCSLQPAQSSHKHREEESERLSVLAHRRDSPQGAGQASRDQNLDPLKTAFEVLDSVIYDCCDPGLATLAAEHIDFDSFARWAEESLGAAPEIAAAAYRQTVETHKAAVRGLVSKPPSVPRSLFPVLLLNMKLELQKQDMNNHVQSSLVSKTLTKKLPGSSSPVVDLPELHFSSNPFDPWSQRKKNPSSAQGSASRATRHFHVDAAVKEIESVLQSSGFHSDECHKVAVDLVNAGASDMRTIVRLLQQDNTTLSKVGLQPSHVLRVLRYMAKQPSFAAEAPSFRLTLADD